MDSFIGSELTKELENVVLSADSSERIFKSVKKRSAAAPRRAAVTVLAVLVAVCAAVSSAAVISDRARDVAQTEPTPSGSPDGSGGTALPGPGTRYTVHGEDLTDAEAGEYFAVNLPWILSSLSSSGVEADGAKVSEKGYCHVKYDAENDICVTDTGFRDYILFSGDVPVAILTLCKENGAISCSPAFGGEWFGAYGEFLKAHAGTPLLFVYLGSVEAVVLPDGSCFSVSGFPTDKGSEKLDYKALYNERAVYTP